jgi:hypothetical protein
VRGSALRSRKKFVPFISFVVKNQGQRKPKAAARALHVKNDFRVANARRFCYPIGQW